MAEQITDLDALAGKTIARAFRLGEYNWRDEALGLIFADGTFLRVGYNSGYEAGDGEVDWESKPSSNNELVAFGLVSQEEIDRAKADAIAKDQERQLARERAEYERLRAKFEGGATP